MRARKTSPALMCKSDAPRSTAALMIFSMSLAIRSVSSPLVDNVPHRTSRCEPSPVVGEQLQLPPPVSTRRCRRDMRREQQPGDRPEIVVRRQRLTLEYVEHRSRHAPSSEALRQGAFVEQGAASDIDDNRAVRKMVEPVCRHQPASFGRGGRGHDENVRCRKRGIERIDAEYLRETVWNAALRATSNSAAAHAERRKTPRD